MLHWIQLLSILALGLTVVCAIILPRLQGQSYGQRERIAKLLLGIGVSTLLCFSITATIEAVRLMRTYEQHARAYVQGVRPHVPILNVQCIQHKADLVWMCMVRLPHEDFLLRCTDRGCQ